MGYHRAAAILARALVSIKGWEGAARGPRRFTEAQWRKKTKKAGMGERGGLRFGDTQAGAAPLMSPPVTPSQQQKSIFAMESVMEALCKSASLFEVTVPDYKQLKACHKEVRLLKELWDMIVMVRRAMPCGMGTMYGPLSVRM